VQNMPLSAVDPTGTIPIVPIFTGAVGGVAGAAASYLIQRFYQGKCEVDWRDVANAGAWGALAGAALPYAGGSLVGVAGIGSLAGAGQYMTSMAWSSESFSGSGLAWSTGAGALGGSVGGKFSRAMGYPGGYYGWIGTAMPQPAWAAKETATMAANGGFWSGVKNGVAGIIGGLPNERAGDGGCTCKRQI